MATNTTKLNLKKPAQEDFYNINDFNENFDKIDDFAGDVWTISENGMVSNVTDMNDLVTSGYYKGSSVLKNTPDTPKNGDIIIVFTWDKNSVLQIYSTTQAGYPIWYRKSNFGDDGSGNPTRVWTNWKRFAIFSDVLPLSGGTLSGSVGTYSNEEYPQLFAGNDFNNRCAMIYSGGLTQFHCASGATNTTLAFANEKFADISQLLQLHLHNGTSYNIFGEHNKPTNDDVIGSTKITTGSYVGVITNADKTSEVVLSFDFAPKLILLRGKSNRNDEITATFLYGCKGNYISVYASNSVSSQNITADWEGNSIKFVGNASTNWSDITYPYVAIG